MIAGRVLTILLSAIALQAAGLPTIDESRFADVVRSHRGSVVLYDFWATWCEPCRTELPRLVQLQRKAGKGHFELVTISADEPEQDADAAAFLRRSGFAGQAWRKEARRDEDFINAIDPKWSGALPALFLFDRNGRKVRSFIGETDVAVVERAIADAAARAR